MTWRDYFELYQFDPRNALRPELVTGTCASKETLCLCSHIVLGIPLHTNLSASTGANTKRKIRFAPHPKTGHYYLGITHQIRITLFMLLRGWAVILELALTEDKKVPGVLSLEKRRRFRQRMRFTFVTIGATRKLAIRCRNGSRGRHVFVCARRRESAVIAGGA